MYLRRTGSIIPCDNPQHEAKRHFVREHWRSFSAHSHFYFLRPQTTSWQIDQNVSIVSIKYNFFDVNFIRMFFCYAYICPCDLGFIVFFINVVVNFMCPLDLDHEVPRHWAKRDCWVCLWECFQMRVACDSGDAAGPLALPRAGGHQLAPLRAWIEQRGGGRKNWALPA